MRLLTYVFITLETPLYTILYKGPYVGVVK